VPLGELVERSTTMIVEEIPRVFQLRAGDQLGEVRAHGVQWPDGSISVRWPDVITDHWASFDDPAAAIVHNGEATVVWLRQDTYTDLEPTR
jgi:hypothetical protein